MDTVIPFNRNSFLQYLENIAKFSNTAILKVKSDLILTVASSEDNTIILYSALRQNTGVEEDIRLNITDVKRLACGLSCIGQDDTSLVIKKKDNKIKCQGKDSETGEKAHFNYHLADDSVLRDTSLNIQKILNIETQLEVTLTREIFKKILSGLTFSPENTKIYLQFDIANKVIGVDITDKVQQNVNNIAFTFKVDNLVTDETHVNDIPVKIEFFKQLNSCSKAKDFKFKINTQYNIIIVDVHDSDNNIYSKYIVSGLVK